MVCADSFRTLAAPYFSLAYSYFGFAESTFTRKEKKVLAYSYFGFAESTFARQNKEKQVFLWFCARLIVPLHLNYNNKVLQ